MWIICEFTCVRVRSVPLKLYSFVFYEIQTPFIREITKHVLMTWRFSRSVQLSDHSLWLYIVIKSMPRAGEAKGGRSQTEMSAFGYTHFCENTAVRLREVCTYTRQTSGDPVVWVIFDNADCYQHSHYHDITAERSEQNDLSAISQLRCSHTRLTTLNVWCVSQRCACTRTGSHRAGSAPIVSILDCWHDKGARSIQHVCSGYVQDTRAA